MTFRLPLTSLLAGLIVLGLAHACYYQYYQEPPADFAYRRCQVGCDQDVQADQEVYKACCVPVSSGAIIPATCSVMASSAEAKGTTCSWSAVETHDMPSSFQQPPPRTSVAPPAASVPCITTWVTETATPSCAPAIPAVPTSTEVASKINAVPTSLDQPAPSVPAAVSSPPIPPVVIPSSAPPTTTAPPAVITSAPPVPPVVSSSAPPPPPIVTSSAPPKPPTNTCACDHVGALPPRDLDRRGGGGGGASTCACPLAPTSTSVINPTNTCACDYSGSLPPRNLKERTDGPKTCACPAKASQTSAADPCPSEVYVGSPPEKRGDQCLSGAVPPGAAEVVPPDERGFEGRKRELPPADFVPEDDPAANIGSTRLVNSMPTSEPVVPHSPEVVTSAPPIAAPACTTTMTTTITPACEPTEQPSASLINGIPTSGVDVEPSKTKPAHPANPTESEDCEELEYDDDDGPSSLPPRDLEAEDY